MVDDTQLAAMAAEICAVPGVVGVTLGGSRARGDALPGSDFDLGVYVSGPRDVDALSRLGTRWSRTPVAVGGAGSWGPWVDSGAWLTVDETAVDWILRDVDRVVATAERARRGEFAFVLQAGHPLGFLDVAYVGELALARLLADPTGALHGLQDSLREYPPRLRDAMVDALWEADFVTSAAGKAVVRLDTAYVGLCLSRAVMVCAHALHADAGVWVTNEKGLVPGIVRLPRAPRDFSRRVSEALGSLGADPDSLRRAVDVVSDLVTETSRLLGRR